jgi:hypothetical protein
MTVLLGGALLIKPALALSQLAIDVDKSWRELDAAVHIPAWAPLFGWNDRKRITVTGSVDGAKTNYHMPLTVHYGAGIDAAGHIYLNYKCLPDFGDIRFANNAGVNLPYWVESYTTGVSASMWVRFDSIPASPGTVDIWVYFNNSAGLSASDGAATFIKFEGWERGVNGSPITLAGGSMVWTEDHVGDAVISTEQAYGGTRSAKIFRDTHAPNGSYIRSVVPWSTNQSVRWRLYKKALTGGVRLWHGTVAYCVDLEIAADGSIWYTNGAEVLVNTGFDIALNAWVLLEINDFTGTTFDLWLNGVRICDNIQLRNQPWVNNQVSFGNYDVVAAHDYYMDEFLVRNWTPNEPTFSSYGPDEPYEIFYGITSLKELAAAMIKGDILFSDGAILARRASGPIGSILTTHDVGADPTWTYPP